jgi:glycine oxidase
MSRTSMAAAGMLGAGDPHNPPELQLLSSYSLSLYPAFLDRIATLSGMPIPLQTSTTIQYLDDGPTRHLAENSIDPRQLGSAILHAVRQTGINLHEDAERIEIQEGPDGIDIRPLHGPRLLCRQLVHASGAWFQGPPAVVRPRKGQMLRVRIPSVLALCEVHRSPSIYIVPRTQGPQAGTALIGATDEDAGFDLTTHSADLDRLRIRAAELLPAFASAGDAPQVEAWAGIRPGTPDDLPLIGPLLGSSRQWVATGHYRNGILLAPATAAVLAGILEGKPPAIDLKPFTPARFR